MYNLIAQFCFLQKQNINLKSMQFPHIREVHLAMLLIDQFIQLLMESVLFHSIT